MPLRQKRGKRMWTSIKRSRTFFVLTLIVWAFVLGSANASTPPVKHQNDAKVYQEHDNTQYAVWDPRGWNSNSVVAVVTTIYAIAAILQLLTLRRQAHTAHQSLVAVQRAFVSVQGFEFQQMGNDLRVMPRWVNGGATITKDMVNYISWKPFPTGQFHDDYGFPDLDGHGNEIVGHPVTTPLVIGPHASILANTSYIPTPLLEDARNGLARIFIWGWAEYWDIFDRTPLHRTEFCNELSVKAVGVIRGGVEMPPGTAPIPGDIVHYDISFVIYGQRNRAN
jgi:hypothetical protein